MGVLELIQQKAFLGKEFLTWLWFRAEHDPVIELPGGKKCEVELLNTLLLDAHYGDAKATALKGESPGTSPEAGAALLEGKKLKRARLKLSMGDADWTVSLDGETLQIGGMQMPKSGRIPFDESLALRMEYILEFDGLLAELVNLFLERRLDKRLWGNDLKKIHKWVDEK